MSPTGSAATAITRTATDALQAKYSAILLAEYPAVFVPPPNSPSKSNDPEAPAHDTRYRAWLHRLTHVLDVSLRRQTPLVHVGYAVRVATVLHHVERFISFHSVYTTDTPLQIVVVGAGWDVTGLWATGLSPSTPDVGTLFDATPQTPPRHVMEIDMPSVALAKAQALRQLGVWDEVPVEQSSDVLYQGVGSGVRFTIVGVDLHDLAAVQRVWTTHGTRHDARTLVLCELVVAYLPPTACDALLRLWAQKLVSGDCLLMYEPLGPFGREDQQEPSRWPCRSVVESYQQSYSAMFTAKLTRGQADVPAGIPQNPFWPLAATPRAAQDRLERVGWSTVHAATVAHVASQLGPIVFPREPFDEPAALALHVSSYALVCAFATNAPTRDTVPTDLLPHYMCGEWIHSRGWVRSPVPMPGTNVWITRVTRPDEPQVRRLFGQSYAHWSDQYRSIRKLVQSALRTDLGVASVGVGTHPSTHDAPSSIARHYLDMGGDFIVAVQLASHGHDSVTKSNATSDVRHTRRVLGAMGLRQWTPPECASRRHGSNETRPTAYFEIQRFFVDEDVRGQGIGTALWTTLWNQLGARYQQADPPPDLCVMATTPTILEHANRFYTSHQFTMDHETPSGDLTLRTYALRRTAPTVTNESLVDS